MKSLTIGGTPTSGRTADRPGPVPVGAASRQDTFIRRGQLRGQLGSAKLHFPNDLRRWVQCVAGTGLALQAAVQGETGIMFSNRTAVVALASACVVAAAGGGYLASRQNAGIPAAQSVAVTPGDALEAQPVEETEALIAEPLKPVPAQRREISQRPASQPAPAARPTPAPRPTPTPTAAHTSSSIDLPRPSTPTSAPVSEPVQTATPAVEAAAPTARDDEVRAPEIARAPEPPARAFEELVVSADSVIGLQMETAVNSERARVEDRVEARVVRDVKVGGAVAIPAGSHAIGSVMVVERGGKVKERARLGIRFHTLVLADGTRLPITTETLYRTGEAPGNASAAKIGGGAAAGAILGAILGGAKGAAIGGTIGAGAGTASVMTSDRSAATFPAGTDVTARILSPVTVTVEK